MIIREQPRWQELTQDISGAAIEALCAGLLILAEIMLGTDIPESARWTEEHK